MLTTLLFFYTKKHATPHARVQKKHKTHPCLEAVSVGERRLVAVTGQAALTAREQASRLEKEVDVLLALPEEQLGAAILKFKDDLSKTALPGLTFFLIARDVFGAHYTYSQDFFLLFYAFFSLISGIFKFRASRLFSGISIFCAVVCMGFFFS